MDGTCLNSHAELLSKCRACGDTIKLTSLSLPRHPYHASNCSEFLTDQNAVETHLRDDHKIERNFCSLYKSKLLSVESCQDRTHVFDQEVDLWKCPDCDRRLIMNTNFLELLQEPVPNRTKDEKAHVKVRTIKNVSQQQPICQYPSYPFACFRCRRAFAHQVEAMDHAANRCRYRRKNARCSTSGKFAYAHYYLCDFPFCGAQYATPALRTRHFHKSHTKHGKVKKLSVSDIRRYCWERPQVCSVCDAEIFSEKLFRSHMRLVHGVINVRSCQKCQTQRKKKKCQDCLYNTQRQKLGEYAHRSYYAPHTKIRDSRKYFVGTQDDFTMTECSAPDVANGSLLGELQDMCVSSTEMNLKEKVFTGISEFCLHGELPQDDVDYQRIALSSESDNPPVDCNEKSLYYTGHLAMDQKDPSGVSNSRENDDRLKTNIFNKLFSDLLKDGFQLEACVEDRQSIPDVNTAVSSSLSSDNAERSSNHRNIDIPSIKAGNIASDRGIDAQQLPNVLNSKAGLSKNVKKQLPSFNSFMELVPNSQVKSGIALGSFGFQSLLAQERCLEPEDTPASQKADIVPGQFNPLVISHATQASTTVEEIKEDQACSVIRSQSELQPELSPVEKNSHAAAICSSTDVDASPSFKVISYETNADVHKDEHLSLPDLESMELSTSSSSSRSLNDGTADLEKMLDSPPLTLTSSSDVDEVATYLKNTENDDLSNPTDVSCLHIADTSHEISLGSKASLKHQLGGVGNTELLRNCVPVRSNSDISIIASDEIFEHNQTWPAEANNLCDLKSSNDCHLGTNPHCELNGSIGKDVSNFEQVDFDSCSTIESDKVNMSIAEVNKHTHSFHALETENHRLNNSIPTEVFQNGHMADIIHRRLVSNQKSKAQILSQGGSPVARKPFIECENGSYSTLNDISYGDYDVNDNEDDINPELENDIILAIQSYMAKDNTTMDAQSFPDHGLSSMQITHFAKVGVSSESCGQNQLLLKTRGPLVDNLSSCSTDLSKKEFCHRNMHIQPLGLNEKTILKLPGEPTDSDVSCGILYQEWMMERACHSTVTNHKKPLFMSELFTKGNTESHVRITNHEDGSVDRSKQYLNENANDLSSDEIRMRLRHQTSDDISSDKINEINALQPDCPRTNDTEVSYCLTCTLPNITPIQLSSPNELHGQFRTTSHSQSITPTTDSTLIQTGLVGSPASYVKYPLSNRKICSPYRDVSRGHIDRKLPHKPSRNSSVSVAGHLERDISQWRSLLKECGRSSPVRSANPSSLSCMTDRPLSSQNEKTKKVRRKSVSSSTIQQPLFEFHKLSELASKKKVAVVGDQGTSSDSTAVNGPREENVDSYLCDESRRHVVPSNINIIKSGNSLESSNDTAILCEAKNHKASTKQSKEILGNIDNKRKGVMLKVNPSRNFKRRRTSAGSYFQFPNQKQSVANVVTDIIGSDMLVARNASVHATETSRLLSDCLSGETKLKPRFMRSRSYDVDLEKKIEQSLLSAEKCVVELPEKYRVLGSSTLTTICSETFHSLLKPDHCPNLEDTTGTESTPSDSDSDSSSDTEMKELERKISEKRDEMSKLMSEIRNVKTRIAKRSKSGLKQSCVLSQFRKRYESKRLPFIPSDDKLQPYKRFKDINDNNATVSHAIVKDLKINRKVNKFETKRPIVRLGMIGSQKGSPEWVNRTWFCSDCRKSFKVQPCAVSLARC